MFQPREIARWCVIGSSFTRTGLGSPVRLRRSLDCETNPLSSGAYDRISAGPDRNPNMSQS